ncbi:MAG TPA: MBL fold metallo-hydrolase [Gemmatimonadaceae bacterium]|nr:MBL fold metallo-hydrolase [Gemmatimonadaceae bacterium]
MPEDPAPVATIRLTTVGTGTVSPSPRRVSAGHLLQAGDVRLLMDCGSGVVHRMAALGLHWQGVTHVALTHFHADHIADLCPLIFAWRYGDLPARTAPVEVLGPPGTALLLDRLAAAFGDWVTAPGFPLTVREIAPGDEIPLADGVTLSARKVPHTDESVAYSVSAGRRRVVYTGDTGWDAELAAWAAGCDVLLAECSLPDEQRLAIHLTPSECGELARLARPGRLVLTHFYPPVDRLDVAGLVARHWEGPVSLAEDGWSLDIED